jgi:fumarate hydratase subunit alpha
MIPAKIFEETAFELLRKASIELQPDVKKALKYAYETETATTAKTELKNIIENVKAAEELNKPICQDTGIISFFIKSNTTSDFKQIKEALIKATIKATETIPLRPNAVHPLTRKNSGNNVGEYLPNIQWIHEDIDHFELTAWIKGGGGENMSALAMLLPSDGLKGIKNFIINSVVKAGAQPCPPTILGIGIGGTVDLTFKLAKLALLRPIGQRNIDSSISNLEKELLELVNETGIGPMGLGGKTTALDVKIEYAHCHTASLPVGVNFDCWAHRYAKAIILPDKSVEYKK